MTELKDLTEFLLREIEKDERKAREASEGPWSHDPTKEWFFDVAALARARAGIPAPSGEEFVGARPGGVTIAVAVTGPSNDPQSMADAAHIAHWDPERVLAECEAKRRIVEMHAIASPAFGRDGLFCDHCSWQEQYEGFNDHYEPWPCPTLRITAKIYADRPDYDERWRP